MRALLTFTAVLGLVLPGGMAEARVQVRVENPARGVALVPDQCWGKSCLRRVDFTCAADGTVRVAVDIPWSRQDLPPAEFAGESMRVTFADAAYRTTGTGVVTESHITRHRSRVTIVMNGPPSRELLTMLNNSRNVAVAGPYGSYRVRTTGAAAKIERLRAACARV